MATNHLVARGRGTAENPPNRFEQIVYERDPDWNEADDPNTLKLMGDATW